jgi:DNA replication and repair protein RecF
MIAPDDVDLVREGSESRRRFFDTIISQLDPDYLDNLIRYNHALKQRNSLLKMFQETGKPDWIAVESYDHLLMAHGEPIANRRIGFVKEFLPVFRKYFTYLVDEKEVAGLDFASDILKVGYAEGLFANRQRDLALQRTNFGIHRDDYLFTLGGGDLKRLGSQGQQKSFVIALKLAQFEIVEKYKGFKPILLLDDIFDKLDDHRIARLLELIQGQFGQLFITDARPARTVDLLRSVKVPAAVFHVAEGRVRLSGENDVQEVNRG